MIWGDPVLCARGMPIWANYIARDNDGKTYVYEHEPYCNDEHGCFDLAKGNQLGGRAAEIHWPPAYEPARGVISHVKESR